MQYRLPHPLSVVALYRQSSRLADMLWLHVPSSIPLRPREILLFVLADGKVAHLQRNVPAETLVSHTPLYIYTKNVRLEDIPNFSTDGMSSSRERKIPRRQSQWRSAREECIFFGIYKQKLRILISGCIKQRVLQFDKTFTDRTLRRHSPAIMLLRTGVGSSLA